MTGARAEPVGGHRDPADAVAVVLAARQDVLLRVHRHRLGREDLEDCLSQAALELIGRARAQALTSEAHIANALEQKFLSRVTDRQRSLAVRTKVLGRPLEARGPLDDVDPGSDPAIDVAARGGDPLDTLSEREQIRRIREVASELSGDQRLVLACQVSLGMESGEFCARYGWSAHKFQKVASRARAKLRKLLAEYELGERCGRLERDVVAYAAHVASPEQVVTVREHIANCAGCAAHVRDLRLVGERVGAVLPVPLLAAAGSLGKVGLAAKVAGVWRALTASLPGGGGPAAAGGAAAAGTASGATKAALAALCAAALAGGGPWVLPHGGDRGNGSPQPSALAPAPAPTRQIDGRRVVSPGVSPAAKPHRAPPRRGARPTRRRAANTRRATRAARAATAVPPTRTLPSAVSSAPRLQTPPVATARPAQSAAGSEFGIE